MHIQPVQRKTPYRLCLPLVSIGNKHIATKAAKSSPPDAYMGALGFACPALTATIGAQRPAMRLRQEAMPVAVPLFGAGKTSGVLDFFVSTGLRYMNGWEKMTHYAYRTPYMMF